MPGPAACVRTRKPAYTARKTDCIGLQPECGLHTLGRLTRIGPRNRFRPAIHCFWQARGLSKHLYNDCASRPKPQDVLPGPDSHAAQLLGGQGMRHSAALRHGGGCRHISSGNHVALGRAKSLEGSLCPAITPAQGWPLWRKPQPLAALLPVSGDPETIAAGSAGPVSRIAVCHRHRPRQSRYPLC